MSDELYARVEEYIKGTEFASVADFVAFVLREVLEEEEGTRGFSREEEEQVKKRLRALGYMDE